MKIRELQDRINEALAEFDGQKFTGSVAAGAPEWKAKAIDDVLAETPGANFLGVGVWSIDADIDGPGGLKVAGEHVAEITASLDRYGSRGTKTIKSIRVEFRADLLERTLAGTRARLLELERRRRLENAKTERARLLDEYNAKNKEIELLRNIYIEEAST